jgi:predicted NUDIX family NTP pyrophosphohydrolase
MSLQSAGILLYRIRQAVTEVLLVHPGGPYFVKRDTGVWSIPKGLFESDEDGLAAARREFQEELGVACPAVEFLPLQAIKQKGGKTVYAWAAKGDMDVSNIVSNTFQMEYPYKSGRWITVSEVDKAEWFTLPEAAEKIIPAQLPFLHQLATILSKE